MRAETARVCTATPVRPVAVTLVAVVAGLSFAGLSFAGLVAYAVVLAPRLAGLYSDVYVALWFGSVAATAATAATGALGCWRMRRWGLHTYAAVFAAATAYGLRAGVPFPLPGVAGSARDDRRRRRALAPDAVACRARRAPSSIRLPPWILTGP